MWRRAGGDRQEAAAGLEMERVGRVPGPIERGPKGIEFYDAHGLPWDVKTPRSPPSGAPWSFNVDQTAESLRKQLHQVFPNRAGTGDEPVRVILNTTYMTSANRRALWTRLNELVKSGDLTAEQLGRLHEVNTLIK